MPKCKRSRSADPALAGIPTGKWNCRLAVHNVQGHGPGKGIIMRDFLDTIIMEEDPFLDETPEEVVMYTLDGTLDGAGHDE